MIELAIPPAARREPASDLIEHYEAVAELSRAMRAAASAGDWDRFASLSQDCEQSIAQVRVAAAATPLPAALQPRRMALLRVILENDAEIRRHVAPSLERISAWLTPAARGH